MKRIGKSSLSEKVQWLFELGGTGDARECIIGSFVKDKSLYPSTFHGAKSEMWWNDVKENPHGYNPSNTFWFTSNASDGSPGHWIYYDTNGVEWNSYKLNHQKMGSHTFCQSFTLMYAISHLTGNRIITKLVNELSNGGSNDEYAENMCSVIQFWQYVLMSMSTSSQDKLIDLIKMINSEYCDSRIVNRLGKYRENYVIAEKENDITISFITSRLDEMKVHLDEMVEIL